MEKRYTHDKTYTERGHTEEKTSMVRRHIRRLEKGHIRRVETHIEGDTHGEGTFTESLEETRRGDYTERGLHGEGRGTQGDGKNTERRLHREGTTWRRDYMERELHGEGTTWRGDYGEVKEVKWDTHGDGRGGILGEGTQENTRVSSQQTALFLFSD